MTDETTAPDEWATVEIMGYHKCAGRISEAVRFGATLLRVDVPLPDGGFATEYFSGSSVYRLRPCTEEIARRVAAELGDPRPVMPLAPRLPAPELRDHYLCEED